MRKVDSMNRSEETREEIPNESTQLTVAPEKLYCTPRTALAGKEIQSFVSSVFNQLHVQDKKVTEPRALEKSTEILLASNIGINETFHYHIDEESVQRLKVELNTDTTKSEIQQTFQCQGDENSARSLEEAEISTLKEQTNGANYS